MLLAAVAAIGVGTTLVIAPAAPTLASDDLAELAEADVAVSVQSE